MLKDPEQLLNWKQACTILGCKKSHFYNLINTGELAAERSGTVRGIRVRRRDCEEYKKNWDKRYSAYIDSK